MSANAKITIVAIILIWLGVAGGRYIFPRKTVDTPPSQFDAGITMVTPETETISILEEKKRCDEADGEFFFAIYHMKTSP